MSEEDAQKKTERLHMLMSPSELEEIDDWRFRNRISNRSEAIRRLCQIGLVTDDKLESLTDEMLDISSALSSLDTSTLELWVSIANPATKGDALDREATAKALVPLMDQLELIEASVSEVAAALASMFAAMTGLSQVDIEHGRKISQEVTRQINEKLEHLRSVRSRMSESRKEMQKYSFRNSEEGEEKE
ncbi:hypothetical protein [Brucella intermedia]|uniref:hypothetical protein n=1 Tax=Brucella intermedia TaxID=94625 RepID=UPI0022490DE5|nr:hypothetical protein [Brucella intermedia]